MPSVKPQQSFCQILHSYSKQRHCSFSMELLFISFFPWTERCLSSIFPGSGTVSAETSNKIILKQYHGKLQVKPFQCDSFKSNDKTQTFLQEKNCWILSSLPMFTEHGVSGLLMEPHANILTSVVGITPISPQIWLVWRVKSCRALNFFRCTEYV